ncbi:MAG TPA: molybdopterin molybdotransferase MoeA, partial [Woeseiaceae bacterium]|nr:molybdopterin molybdotransferase MoeA [Woeseiaceae bacterium]
PFDRVTMDGIALRHSALAAGRRRFRIAGTQHAGDAVSRLHSDADCIEVMTGAVLPAGTDCVVPVERLDIRDGMATLEDGYRADAGQYVHARGSDHRRGHTTLTRGRRITPIDIALIASAGCARVRVAAQPAVRVVSTGNELVPAGLPVAAQQIRLSNGPALLAMLAARGYRDCRHEHLRDEPATLRTRLAALLEESQVLVLSGGVSMGKADFVPQVLAELGVENVFHKIAQRPGKPLWFGRGPGGQVVFALPGNPVSTLVCCRHYVLPALAHAAGAAPAAPAAAVLAADYRFAADLTCFLPVRLASDDAGHLVATPVPTNTSGDFTALSATDGYVELARGESLFAAGSVHPLYRWSAE